MEYYYNFLHIITIMLICLLGARLAGSKLRPHRPLFRPELKDTPQVTSGLIRIVV